MQLTLEIPDPYLQGLNETQTAQKIRLYAALLMLQSSQLSRDAACEFSDITNYDFLLACKQYQINAIDRSAEAIEVDVLRYQQRYHQ